MERLDDDGLAIAQRGTALSERSVGSEQFGRFLIAVFDEWLYHDVGDVFVQTFEATLRSWTGLPPGTCVFDEVCGRALALEHNGDVYSCDHFAEPDHLLGNIGDASLGDLLRSGFQYRFGQDKRDRLPRYCRECAVRFACNGECPKNSLRTAARRAHGRGRGSRTQRPLSVRQWAQDQALPRRRAVSGTTTDRSHPSTPAAACGPPRCA